MMREKDLEGNQMRVGKEDGTRDPHPLLEEDEYDAENDEQFNLFAWVIANALRQRTRVPAEPPAMFRHEKHQDIHM